MNNGFWHWDIWATASGSILDRGDRGYEDQMRIAATGEAQINDIPHAADVNVCKRLKFVTEVNFPRAVKYNLRLSSQHRIVVIGESKLRIAEVRLEITDLVTTRERKLAALCSSNVR